LLKALLAFASFAVMLSGFSWLIYKNPNDYRQFTIFAIGNLKIED